ncbi:MAG: threonine dehydrogenase related Zn-dependent dehydrogenase [Haloquadratum walsbyi J07HQW1]|uniref:Threonine dehydrogenase related Zn-dependent dehydrogenase n=1 Tax=Haloquadratum walsbyi J07HQW1 TaxID=1238424 RepID=U1N708_9EURY|nr:MAG: threonine dehydrogenase related Zn-dependent dehydrogenase [Haloquadratum walsbyi J07HQW1]
MTDSSDGDSGTRVHSETKTNTSVEHTDSARELVFSDVREVRLNSVSIDNPDPNDVIVETTVSAISPGTELLLYRGEVPEQMAADATLETLDGDLSYPTAYGYAAVGDVVETGKEATDRLGERVFAFHPHQSRFCVDSDTLVSIPDDWDAETAALLPSAETATNFLLDGSPRVGERVVVFGAGVIGLCTIQLLANLPISELVVIEPIPARRELARSFGADRALDPSADDEIFTAHDPPGADLVYEVSGQPAALNAAIDVVGYDGRIIVGSWYGNKPTELELGGDFHRDRITVTSSQVSTIDPDLRGRWTTDRRLSVAIEQLNTIDVDALITDRVSFRDAPSAYRRLTETPESTLQVLLTYS